MRAVGPALLCAVCAVAPVRGAEEFVLGGTAGPTWSQVAGDAPVIDFASRPGWLQPSSVAPGVNVAIGSLDRGGYVVSPNAQAVLRLTTAELAKRLGYVVDDNHTTAFEAKNVVATGIFLVLDLGARFGVDHIRFYPRQEFRADFMKGYVVSINDGLFGADFVAQSPDRLPNRSLFTIIGQEQSNNRDTVDVRFPLQYVRYVRLESTQRFNWEIDELELFGRGFVPEAEYVTAPLDLRRPSLWGRVRWALERTGRAEKSRLSIRSRSGPAAEVDDRWSPWSAPFTLSGEPIRSPSPRRYIQFSIRFESDGLGDGVAVDSLVFEHSAALATSAVAEVWPQAVEVAEDTLFHYAVRLSGARAIDGLEVNTDAPVRRVRALRIDGVDSPFSVVPAERGLSIRFAPQSGDRLLEVEFETAVLRYETVLEGLLLATAEDSLPQRVATGNAMDELAGDDLSVRVPVRGQDVLHALTLATSAFSPNGDGVNDEAVIAFDILHLTRTVPVTVDIYDLLGRRVARLPTPPRASGRYVLRWNGRDGRDDLVPPGTYLIHMDVDTDRGIERASRTVSVVY